MNIFYVHRDPFLAAQSLGDKHVIKMLLKSVQLLSGAYHMEGATMPPPNTLGGNPYRKTHYHHPCAIWVRSDLHNWTWLLNHASGLYAEYVHRWPGKPHHGCLGALSWLIAWPPTWMYNTKFWDPPQCMPDEFKIDGDTIGAYRSYYNSAKRELHKWTRRTPPNWITATAPVPLALTPFRVVSR